MRNLKLQKYRDNRARQHRARVVAGNGKCLSRTARGYSTEDELNARITVMLLKEYDATLYKDKAGEWRWRWMYKTADVEEIFMISSEGYHNRVDCLHASNLVLDAKRATDDTGQEK
jgi:uncharacterized protein YegP (UPF0339 family)